MAQVTKIDTLVGVVNGVNQTFQVPGTYIPGSVHVFVNGVLYDNDDSVYGWEEQPLTNTIVFDVALQTGDIPQAVWNEGVDELEVNVRLDALVKKLNDIQVAITNLASKAQLRQLTLLKQQDITNILARLTALEQDVTILKQTS